MVLQRLGAYLGILELPLLAASSKGETALMIDKTWQPRHELPDKTDTCHTDTQWKAEGGEGRGQELLKCTTYNALTSSHHNK